MESGIMKIMRLRALSQTSRLLCPVRECSNSNVPDLGKVEKRVAYRYLYPGLMTQYWNERVALKKQRKKHKFPGNVRESADLIRFMQSLKDFPKTFTELLQYVINRKNARDLIDQKYLPERESVLKPDLAVAHFIVRRGGSVKFFGQPFWVGVREEKKTLPFTYIPGLHVEALKAEGTYLTYEGLQNIRKLRYIKFLSLKGLDDMNDWCLDWVSKEFYATLQHLDISHCENITYRGLSCFYRFENLKVLNLEGVPDTPELKLAALMLLDIKPNLEIRGIDLDVPDKIDSLNPEEGKQISEGSKLISEDKKQVAKM